MNNVASNRERGVALLFSILALLLLTAIAGTLIVMSSTETSVNSNYRHEQMAYFAAKAGIEEARARMMASDPNSINTGGTPLPIVVPTTLNKSVIYIVNPGAAANSVQPWNSANAFADDELCHDFYGVGFGAVVAPGIRCNTATLPAGSGWYTSYNSALPFNTTAAALPYKWVRITPKLNSSLSYLTGNGAAATISNYLVNTNVVTSASALICWDGAEEVPLLPADTQCSQMLNTAGAPMTSVYLLAALGISSNAPNAARKMVQAEVALTPTPPFPYGLFATSNACPAISFNGSNASTNSYTTANGGTYATTQVNTGGDVGSNGGVSVQNGSVGGIVGVLQPPPAGVGTCATPFTIGPQGSDVGPNCPGPSCVPNSPTYVPQPYTFPVPPAPNPLPPNTAYSPPACAGKGKVGNCMVPGNYGNISINGTLTLAPGTYNINSFAMQGNGQIIVSPPGAITLNVAGTGQANPIAIAGNGITDDTIPNDFMINYGGNGTVSVAGNGDVTAILNAPNAAVTQKGNGNWYGSILASTVSIGGNAFFHFDRNAALSPAGNGYFTMIGFREIPY